MEKYRSIDSVWELDEVLYVPNLRVCGYLYFNNSKIYVCGENRNPKTSRFSLSDENILSFGYGDGLYGFRRNDRNDIIVEEDSVTYWRINDSKIKYTGYFTKNEWYDSKWNDHHFVLYSDFYNVYVNFSNRNGQRESIKLVNKTTNQIMPVEKCRGLNYDYYCNLIKLAFEDFRGYGMEEEYE